MSEILTPSFLVALCWMLAAWMLSLEIGRVCVVDAFWGPGFVVIALVTAFRNEGTFSIPQYLLAVCVGAWGIRLGWHLSNRVFRARKEDRRYKAMREKFSPNFAFKSVYIVFGLQAVIMFVVALPVTLALGVERNDSERGIVISGVILWLTGLLFEAIGDWQLTRFRSRPENSSKVLDHGLWAYSRHPNYFGDFLVWWGLWLMSVGVGVPYWTMISPLIMSMFLMRYSGVGLLEKDIADRRPEYVQYIKMTNAFFPWFPHRKPLNHNSGEETIPGYFEK